MHATDCAFAHTISTANGGFFDFMNPDRSEFTIEDIAHALSHICRFTGHTSEFYSVAQHCVEASFLVPEQYALQALLHDAAEAFMGDMSTPLKRMIPAYKELERTVEAVVLGRFGLTLPLHPCVKEVDLLLLATERRDLMPHCTAEWGMLEGVVADPDTLLPWAPDAAKQMFLTRYRELRAK